MRILFSVKSDTHPMVMALGFTHRQARFIVVPTIVDFPDYGIVPMNRASEALLTGFLRWVFQTKARRHFWRKQSSTKPAGS